jgi:hypothetical protein
VSDYKAGAHEELIARLKENLPELRKLLAECDNHWGIEDLVYRFYHMSFKVYRAQEMTTKIRDALRSLTPGRPLNKAFEEIVADGTGRVFDMDCNLRWMQETRPIVEALFHAHYMLQMAIKYGAELDAAPMHSLPSGWATFLYLFDLR